MNTFNENKKERKNTNPLYVVRSNGVDVEEANGLFELLLKKTGIDKMIPFLDSLMQILLSQVQTYPIFIEVKKMFDTLFEKIIELIFQIQQLTQKAKI
jgi:hypothetical protein